jgi:hypothetical protein
LRALLLAGAAAAIALLGLAASAQAARDPIASGTTDLHMKKGFARKLANLQIDVLGLGATGVSGNKIGLEVLEGDLDPTNVQGQLTARGGFKLALGGRGVPVTKVVVNTVKGSVFAQVAGARMQLATFPTPTAGREGFGSRFKAGQLTLTEKAATRISNRLGLRGSRRIGSRVISNLFATAQPRSVTLLPQGSATLTLNTATLVKFKAKGVEVPAGFTPVAPATEPSPLAFQLPIGGGEIVLGSSTGAGKVETAGGIQILKSTKTLSPKVVVKSLDIDLTAKSATAELEISPTPPFAGNVGRAFGLSIAVPSGGVVTNPTTRQIEIKGAEARLQSNAVSALNGTFNQPPPEPPPASNLIAGDPLGTFNLQLQAQ